MKNWFATTLLLLATICSSCIPFTRSDYDKVEDFERVIVEFLEYPKVTLDKNGDVYHPVWLKDRVLFWDKKERLKKTEIRFVKAMVRIPDSLFYQSITKSENEKMCFKFSVWSKSGKVGPASYTPVEDCIKSEKQLQMNAIQEERFLNINLWRRTK